MITVEKKTPILVTGVGAIIGQGIIKSLMTAADPVKIIGIDMNPRAVGFKWTDASYVVPRADSDEWPDAICEICNREEIKLILPGIEQDLRALIRHKERISKNAKAFILLNSEEALHAGFDKWYLFQLAMKHQIPVPLACLASDEQGAQVLMDKGPLLLKPRAGMAGKGIFRVDHPSELDNIKCKINKEAYICQQFIGHDDEEFTASCFGNINGTVTGPIILRRKLNYGSTFEAETIEDEGLSRIIRKISSHLSIIGPTNFQFRKKDGEYMLIEVNPRFSSSTSIKSAFGFNEPYMAVQNYAYGISFPEIVPLKRGYCSRFIEDFVQYYEDPHHF